MKSTIKFPKFDAELNTDICDPYNNADLTLILRLGFRQINPAAGAANGTHHDYGDATEPTRKIIKWTPGSWSAWKTNFVSSAQRFWNGKFWLISSSGSFSFVHGGVTYVPNIYCRVKIIGNEAAAASNHHTIDVVRLHQSERWFGSHATLYDSLDTRSRRKARDSAGKPIMQRAHVHEVGHLLGIGHVDIGKAHCPAAGNTNITACYGIADVDKNSVMGSGMQLRLGHAAPWQSAIPAFAMTRSYAQSGIFQAASALLTSWDAKKVRHYPRTEAEVTAGTLVTRRVRR